MKRCGRGGPTGSVKANDAATQPAGKSLTLGRREGKLCEVNPASAINTDEEKSGKLRAEARGNSTPLPHMVHSSRILSGSSRVPGHWEAKKTEIFQIFLRNISRATLCECGEASRCQETNPMYEETDDSFTWPCRVQRNRESVPVQWVRWGRLIMKRCGRGGPAGSVKGNDAAT